MCENELTLDLAPQTKPIKCSSDVVVIRFECIEFVLRRRAAREGEEIGLVVSGSSTNEREEVLRMPATHGLRIVRLFEPLSRILGNRLQHQEALRADNLQH